MTVSGGAPPPNVVPNGYHHTTNHITDDDVWREAPVLIGTTKFDPLPGVKNIMVTGGAGFIASWVVRHLVLTYPDAYNIVSFDKLDYCASLNNTRVLHGRPNFSFYRGDVTNPAEVLDCLERHKIDTIFHFAAQSHVDLSFGNSYHFTHTNVYGTHVLLESARKVGIRRFIHVSTDEVYGEVKEDDADRVESSILAPTNPYAASKAAAEMLVHSYHKSFKLPAIIVRSNNVYGPHQYPEKIIPKFTCLLSRRQPVVLHGDGTPTRRYLYAADAADAFDTILHRGVPGQTYNVGSSDEVSNLALCHHLLALMNLTTQTPSSSTSTITASSSSSSPNPNPPENKKDGKSRSPWILYTRDRPFNDHRYAVDDAKLRGLGWRQKTSLEVGLRATVDWYLRFGERWWGDITTVLSPFPVVAGTEVLEERSVVVSERPLVVNVGQGEGEGEKGRRDTGFGTVGGGKGERERNGSSSSAVPSSSCCCRGGEGSDYGLVGNGNVDGFGGEVVDGGSGHGDIKRKMGNGHTNGEVGDKSSESQPDGAGWTIGSASTATVIGLG